MTRKKINFNNKKPNEDKRYPEEIDAWVNKVEIQKSNNAFPLITPKVDENVNNKKISFLISESLHRKIKSNCAADGVSMQDKLLEIISKEFTD